MQVLRCSRWIVHPFSQTRPAVDDVDGKLIRHILVRKIAPQGIVWIQSAYRFEGERLNAPGLERRMIIARAFSVNLNTAAEFARVFVEGGFEPAVAQTATMQPLRRQSVHFSNDAPGVNVGRTEHFERPGGAASFRESCSFKHYRAGIGARHP